MFKLTSKVNSPYEIEGQVLPAFGAINVPELTDYTRLLRALDVVAIEKIAEEDKPARKRKNKQDDDAISV